MNSWSLLQEKMDDEKKQKRCDAPWIDTTYDGFDEEQIQKVLKVQRQAQKLLDAAYRVADGEVPLGKLIRLGHKDPMSVRVRYEYGAILLALVELSLIHISEPTRPY